MVALSRLRTASAPRWGVNSRGCMLSCQLLHAEPASRHSLAGFGIWQSKVRRLMNVPRISTVSRPRRSEAEEGS
jgi:hypothetical protein